MQERPPGIRARTEASGCRAPQGGGGPEKERANREKAITKALAALDVAQREHDGRSESLEAERRAIDKRIEAEDRRWESDREKLMDVLRRVRE